MSGGVSGRTSGGTLIRRVLVVVGFVGYVAAGFVYWAFGGLVAVPGADHRLVGDVARGIVAHHPAYHLSICVALY